MKDIYPYVSGTEVLTAFGFKPIEEITYSDCIAQVDEFFEVVFSEPITIDHMEYTGDYSFLQSDIDQGLTLLTPSSSKLSCISRGVTTLPTDIYSFNIQRIMDAHTYSFITVADNMYPDPDVKYTELDEKFYKKLILSVCEKDEDGVYYPITEHSDLGLVKSYFSGSIQNKKYYINKVKRLDRDFIYKLDLQTVNADNLATLFKFYCNVHPYLYFDGTVSDRVFSIKYTGTQESVFNLLTKLQEFLFLSSVSTSIDWNDKRIHCYLGIDYISLNTDVVNVTKFKNQTHDVYAIETELDNIVIRYDNTHILVVPDFKFYNKKFSLTSFTGDTLFPSTSGFYTLSVLDDLYTGLSSERHAIRSELKEPVMKLNLANGMSLKVSKESLIYTHTGDVPVTSLVPTKDKIDLSVFCTSLFNEKSEHPDLLWALTVSQYLTKVKTLNGLKCLNVDVFETQEDKDTFLKTINAFEYDNLSYEIEIDEKKYITFNESMYKIYFKDEMSVPKFVFDACTDDLIDYIYGLFSLYSPTIYRTLTDEYVFNVKLPLPINQLNIIQVMLLNFGICTYVSENEDSNTLYTIDTANTKLLQDVLEICTDVEFESTQEPDMYVTLNSIESLPEQFVYVHTMRFRDE